MHECGKFLRAVGFISTFEKSYIFTKILYSFLKDIKIILNLAQNTNKIITK